MLRINTILIAMLCLCVVSDARGDLEITTWTVASGLYHPRVDAGGGWITYYHDRDTSVYNFSGASYAYEVASHTTTGLTGGDFWASDGFSRTDGKNVAWVHEYGTYSIYVQNLSTGAKSAVVSGLSYNPSWMDISGTRLVWADYSANTLNSYDFGNGASITVSGFSSMPRELDLDGDIVVWEDSRNQSSGYHLDIYGYDFSTDQEIQITNDHANNFSPAISGNKVVWRSYDSGMHSLNGYDLGTSQFFQFGSAQAMPRYVAIDGNLVAWIDNRNIDPHVSQEYSVWAQSLLGGDEFMVSGFTGSGSVAVAGDIVTWDAGSNVRAARISGAQCYVARGDFETPDTLDYWNVSGSVAVGIDPHDLGNLVVELTSASPVSISQLVDTPDVSFSVDFDYEFLTADGWLEVYLDGQLLRTIDAPATPLGYITSIQIGVWRQNLCGLTDAELEFVFDSTAAGQQLLLDNIGLSTGIPEPTTILLLGSGMAVVFRRRRRR